MVTFARRQRILDMPVDDNGWEGNYERRSDIVSTNTVPLGGELRPGDRVRFRAKRSIGGIEIDEKYKGRTGEFLCMSIANIPTEDGSSISNACLEVLLDDEDLIVRTRASFLRKL